MRNRISKKTLASALSASLVLVLGGCGGMPSNRSLESIHQPVVARTNYTLDIVAGPGGVSIPEQRRLAGWFEAMDLRYGDRITIDDPLKSGATHAAIQGVAGRYGMIVGDEAPVTPGYVNPGTVRVVVTRSTAAVPGCPDWSAKSSANLGNATSSNYGCANNANLAAMVADPEHLLKGATGKGSTTVMSGTKAIDSYREAPPTGEKGLSNQSTQTGK
ncbi:MAG TPA: CpaD family pilus assembly protein [Novosphingobium sp.]|nr:CpaD family pilus assembly protein [Novosphingobium sp.]HQA16961.1 CpaD family pilus assembly protein [Novosphingobium sp.]